MLSARHLVLEIKVNERIPTWLAELIAAHNLQIVGFSKYCRSIQAAQRIPSARRHSFTAERAQDVLASSLTTLSTLERKMGIDRGRNINRMEVTRGNL